MYAAYWLAWLQIAVFVITVIWLTVETPAETIYHDNFYKIFTWTAGIAAVVLSVVVVLN